MVRIEPIEKGRAIPSRQNTSRRDNITHLSAKGHKRLISTINRIGRIDPPLFLTLTYREYSENYKGWKRDLDAFLKALKRYFPECSGLWRLEFQGRGAPHYHLLIWPKDEYAFCEMPPSSIQAWAAHTWCRIIRDNSVNTLNYSVKILLSDNIKTTAFYLGAYLKKSGSVPQGLETGRH